MRRPVSTAPTGRAAPSSLAPATTSTVSWPPAWPPRPEVRRSSCGAPTSSARPHLRPTLPGPPTQKPPPERGCRLASTPDTARAPRLTPGDRARTTRARRTLGRAGGALVDQALSSGTQLLLIVLVARRADPTTVGAVSVALLAHGFLMGVVRAAVGEIALLRCRADRTATRREACRGLFLCLLAGLVVALGLAAAAAVVGGQVGHFLLLMALAAPLVYCQDLLRYVAYGAGRVEHAIVGDAVWLVVQVAASAVLLAKGDATPTRLVLAWVLGAGFGVLALTLRQRLRPRPVAVGRWWAEERARASGFLADFLVSNGMWQGAFLLLGILMSLEELGALRVAVVSVSPLANLLAGVRTLILAHLAGLRAQPARACRRAAQLGLGLAGAAALYGAGLVLLPDRWGSELFGETWSQAAALVGIIAVAEVIRLPTFAAIDLVKVLGAPMDLVRTRLTGGVAVVAGLLVGAIVAGPRGAALGTAVGYAFNQIIWWRRARMLSRRPAWRSQAVSM
jgi:O-antigen/teichoic acid export membrane protein